MYPSMKPANGAFGITLTLHDCLSLGELLAYLFRYSV